MGYLLDTEIKKLVNTVRQHNQVASRKFTEEDKALIRKYIPDVNEDYLKMGSKMFYKNIQKCPCDDFERKHTNKYEERRKVSLNRKLPDQVRNRLNGHEGTPFRNHVFNNDDIATYLPIKCPSGYSGVCCMILSEDFLYRYVRTALHGIWFFSTKARQKQHYAEITSQKIRDVILEEVIDEKRIYCRNIIHETHIPCHLLVDGLDCTRSNG